MNAKAFKVLEYNKIIEMLAEQAASEMTKKLIRELKPSTDAREIVDLQTQTTEATTVIVRKGAAPLGNFYDIGESIYLARKGGVLSMKQLLQVLYNVKIVRQVSIFLKTDLPPLPLINSIAEVLAPQKYLEEAIDRCILSEDEMSDHASPELRNIRRAIVRQNDAVTARLNNILNSSDNKLYLQDAIVTMRNGRYVIPVKQEHKARFPGIVHDRSQSGATLFVEPQSIVNLNNELRELELAEKQEIERILAELSASVAEHFSELLNNQELLRELDFIFAKGKLSQMMKGEPVEMNTDGMLYLKDARHPLIDAKNVVPINIALGKTAPGGCYHTLVITGPNTGGKTVTLKTVGLLAMMFQSGLHLPASSVSKMPIFTNVFADIGDEQSIEQCLSTFSSHMNNIVNIAKEAGPDTLVLVDELGAGTDPTEGAALAISILEHIRKKGAYTIATTHYNELKKYAISTDDVENASMEFNIETLSPTFKLIIGTPGKSNAFEISQRLGLDSQIIDMARGLLQSGDIEFEDVITALEKDRRAAEEERDEAILLNIAMKKQKEEIEKLEEKIRKERDDIIAKAKEEARGILKEAQELSTDVAKELKELAKMDSLGERTRRYDENKRRLKEADSKYREKIIVEENANPVKAEDLKVGDRVKVLTLGQNGHVLSLPDEKGDLFVQIGLMKAGVNIKNLMLIQEGKKKTKIQYKGSRYGTMYRQKTQSVSLSINVQGKNLDDATMDVDKYLDDAFIAGLESVTIIHGRGEGILKNGLHAMFKKHKHVASFRSGKYNEGGDGVTIVTMKKG